MRYFLSEINSIFGTTQVNFSSPCPLKGHRRIAFMGMICLLFLSLQGVAQEKVFYVAPNGSDDFPGTKEQPFASPERARDAIRELKKENSSALRDFRVVFRGGLYFRTISFDLSLQDGGTPGHPVIYEGASGESVRWIGGVLVPASKFSRLTPSSPGWNRIVPEVREQIKVCRLKDAGVNDPGVLTVRGFGFPIQPVPCELCFNNRMMALARWPDQGFATTGKILDPLHFTFDSGRVIRWGVEPDPWVFGYWKFGWAENYLPVAGIDPIRKVISLKQKATFGLEPNRKWFLLNVLGELDTPGEYYIDRSNDLLYFYPPMGADFEKAEIVLSVLGKKMEPLCALTHTGNITLRNMSFEKTRYSGVIVRSCSEIHLEHCIVRDTGTSGITASGSNLQIEHCSIYDTGACGIDLSGGVRETLTAGNNRIYDCRIHHFGRINRTYQPGVRLSGVGNSVVNCLISDAPHAAILFMGNNHLIERNEICRVCQESDDAGAVYSGRDWGYRGNVIRHNFFHDVRSVLTGYQVGVHGVYLDDCASGTTVLGNIFYRISGRAVMCGGGRDITIENNVIAKCGAAFYTDRRGREAITDKPGDDWNLLEKIQKMNYTRPPWSTAYPRLASILAEGYAQAKEPKGCAIRNNIGWMNGKWLEHYSWDGYGFQLFTIENNIENKDPQFRDEARLDLSLKPGSPALRLKGFKSIPFKEIGVLK